MKKNYICLVPFCLASGITGGNEENLPKIVINYNKEHRPLQTGSLNENLSDGLKKISTSIDAAGKTITGAQAETNKTLQTVATGAQLVGICTGGIYIAKSAQEGIEWLNEWRNPDPEKAARKAAAIREMETLKARGDLNKCLVYKRKESKNAQGIPVACEEAYNEFVGALGFDEAERTVQAFKRFNNPQ